MKRQNFLLVLIFLSSSILHITYGQITAANSTSSAGARIIKPMSLTESSSLHFGSISASASENGTVVLDTNGNRIPNKVILSSSGAPATNATYTVSGTKNASYGVSLEPTIIVTGVDSSATMKIKNLTVRFNTATADSPSASGTLDTNGMDRITLGGTLLILKDQEPNDYSGTFLVSVDYN